MWLRQTVAASVITFGVAEFEREPVYVVRDNGAGFEGTEAGRIFSPFARLPGAKRYKGSGIGLATVERVILRAEGESGKGATFYFTLSGGRN